MGKLLERLFGPSDEDKLKEHMTPEFRKLWEISSQPGSHTELLSRYMVEVFEDKGIDITQRLVFIKALEENKESTDHLEAAATLRQKWGLVDHDLHWVDGKLHILKNPSHE